ncbi:alpha-galactosidase [Auraticoccus monumenti]|uniref:Alpha-galactosidase n=1 Tax=Auraticoccus monumenti TaxID=675864 RepID=A0A1G7A779_9ACTN|nr:alpha-galactosidase [Auraticoccus monumenti]
MQLTGVTALAASGGTVLRTRQVGADVVELTARAADDRPGLRVEVDLGAAVGYWHPGADSAQLLQPDWAGSSATGLVSSAPVGALYDASGSVLLAWAASEAVAELCVTTGVSEERKTFVVDVRTVRPSSAPLQVVLDTSGGPLAATLSRLATWVSDRLPGSPLPVPPVAEQPVYSTWYTFTQDVDAELVTGEARLAAELGCGSVFVDDGWQRLAHGRGYQGCGDWVPDPAKFPDLAATVRDLRATGLGVALWVAPLLLGEESDAFATMAPFAPHREDRLSCHVLDPRRPETRAFVVDTCLRLVTEHGADLLKIDFLEQAMAYRDAPPAGDVAYVGEAMARLLGELREGLTRAGRPGVAFEFRQPYVSPAIARYGEILRAHDCPADSVTNRAASVNARLLAVGQVIHADPMMWGPAGGAAAVAQQLYAGWFAVPQISMRLATLDQEQRTALRGLLRLWREHSEVTLHGELQVLGPERGYDVVTATRADLDRSVTVRSAPVVVDLDTQPVTGVSVVNATPEPVLLARTSRQVLGGVVRSSSGAETGGLSPTGPGLLELAVPAWGSVTLRLGQPA